MMFRSATLALVATAGLALVSTAQATPALVQNLVQNGGFEQVTMPGGNSQINTTNVNNWSTSGYNFIMTAATASTTGTKTFSFGPLTLWGLGNGGLNTIVSSPDGGNFVAADGAYQVGALTQTLTGLVASKYYAVSFNWAGAQQSKFDGTTTEAWTVGFGNQTQTTKAVTDVDKGFTGWIAQTFVFQADGPTDVLSFLAVGTPNGEPPFSLLDGVTATAYVPEPAAMTLLLTAVAGLGFVGLRRRFFS